MSNRYNCEFGIFWSSTTGQFEIIDSDLVSTFEHDELTSWGGYKPSREGGWCDETSTREIEEAGVACYVLNRMSYISAEITPWKVEHIVNQLIDRRLLGTDAPDLYLGSLALCKDKQRIIDKSELTAFITELESIDYGGMALDDIRYHDKYHLTQRKAAAAFAQSISR